MFMWIWKIEEVIKKHGSIENVISKLKELNILDVCIKYHEGSYRIGGGINYRNDFLKYKSIFENNGFTVGSFGYNYFNNIRAESNLIIEALNNSDYYIFHAELDVRNKFVQTEEICKIIRAAHPKAKIGYSSFPIVSYHTDIPYIVFDKYCDFATPRCYFYEMRWTIQKCMDTMMTDHKKLRLNKPLYPSIEAYKLSKEQREKFQQYGYSKFGLWNMEKMDLDCDMWLKNQLQSVIK
jgi:hypothetical protein